MHMCVLIPESAVTECNRLIKRHLFLIVLEPPGLQNLPCSKLIVFKLNVWKCESQRAHIEMGSTFFLTLNNVIYIFFHNKKYSEVSCIYIFYLFIFNNLTTLFPNTFPSSPFPYLPSAQPIHSPSISFQKRVGLPWKSTTHSKLKAGWGNPV